MKIGSKGLALVKEFEGYIKEVKDGTGDCIAYKDTIGTGQPWTIGWGCTEGVTKGLRWTRKQAEAQLLKELTKHEMVVARLITVKLDQNQFDALVSLSYNLGLDAAPTLVKLVNQEKWDEAADAFLLYTKSGGKVRSGLVRRREAERVLFKEWTKKDIAKQSGTLSVIRKWFGLLTAGASSFVGADAVGVGKDYVDWIKEFSSNNKFLVAVFIIACGYGLIKYLEHKKHKEHEEGRYVPSEEV